MTEPSADHFAPQPPATVAHVADFYRRYPGESIIFFTRVEVHQPLTGFSLRITVPDGLVPGAAQATANHDGSLSQLVVVDGTCYLIWNLNKELGVGERCEYQFEATLAPTEHEQALSSQAVVMANVRSNGQDLSTRAAATVTIAVTPKGRLLKYLPALYTEQDELMGRFVMLFESFWGPIEDRIDQVHYYFDPKLAPPDLLPWLATWVDLTLDEQWPDEKRRRLLSSMVELYRKRGTRRGLQQYLEIYTGQQAHITEYRAHNFQLGKITRLGPSAALGNRNVSHTFSVTLNLPAAANEDQRAARRRKIEAIIESEKPVHTAYALIIKETN